MRNFILFIRRFFNLILFLALEIACIILIVRSRSLQGDDILSSSNLLVGKLYQKQNDVVYYFGLRQMNDSLLNENARLRMELAAIRSLDTLRDSSATRISHTGDSGQIVQYTDYVYRTARVINNSVSAANNYLTINRGSVHGVRPFMAVLSGSGVVGRVAHVSKHYASVLSVLNVQQEISAKLKDGTTTQVVWKQGSPDVMMMEKVPPEIKVKKGDSVFVSGLGTFPEGTMIGVVFRTEVNKKNNEQLLYLRPSTNFRNLQYVYVVEEKMSGERKQLEDSTRKATRKR